MNQNLLVTIFFFALLLVILYTAFLIVKPFITALTWAAILAVVVYPAYAWLLKLLRGRASLAAFMITILLTFLIVVPALRIAGFLSEEAVELVAAVHNLTNGQHLEPLKQRPWVKDLLGIWDWASNELATFDIDLREAVVQGAQTSSGFLASQVRGIAQNVFVFTLNVFIALFTLFFFLRDGKALCQRIGRLLPMEPQYQEHLFTKIVDAIFAVVHGCLIVAMVQGLLAGLAYWVLGVPFAILLGVATAFAALLPIGGSTLISIPASIYLFLKGNYLYGVILLGWSLGIVGSIDNLLKPILIGSRLRLPTLFLFFSLLDGLSLFGALGLVLGPVLFALLAALLDLYMKEYANA
ncbi:MAG: AI-2E family transporter [Deltaproteobacteria bacterium]|nr:MAG: AI-2E family transporter [Deltaproteobacteria bacterium]